MSPLPALLAGTRPPEAPPERKRYHGIWARSMRRTPSLTCPEAQLTRRSHFLRDSLSHKATRTAARDVPADVTRWPNASATAPLSSARCLGGRCPLLPL